MSKQESEVDKTEVCVSNFDKKWLNYENEITQKYVNNFVEKNPGTIFFSYDDDVLDYEKFKTIHKDVIAKQGNYQHSDHTFNLKFPSQLPVIAKFKECGFFKSKYNKNKDMYSLYVNMEKMITFKDFLKRLNQPLIDKLENPESFKFDEVTKVNLHYCYNSCDLCKNAPLEKLENICKRSNFITSGKNIYTITDAVADKDGMDVILVFYLKGIMEVKKGWKFICEVQMCIFKNQMYTIDEDLQKQAINTYHSETKFLIDGKRKHEDEAESSKKLRECDPQSEKIVCEESFP